MSMIMKNNKICKPIQDDELFAEMIMMSENRIRDYVKDAFRIKIKNKVEILNMAVKLGFDVNSDTIYSDVPWLYYAVQINDFLMIGNLMKHGADIHLPSKSYHNYNLIHWCILCENLPMLKYFINKKVDVNHLSKYNQNPLEIACVKSESTNNIEYLKTLLSCDNIKISHENEDVPLISYFAVRLAEGKNQYFEIFKIIVDKKHKIGKHESDAIESLVFENKIEPLKIVVNKFRHIINKKCNDDIETMVHLAYDRKHYNIVEYFISLDGFDHTKKNKMGLSYLHLFAERYLVNLIKILLKRFPNMTKMRTGDDMTALDCCLASSENSDHDVFETIEELVSGGVDVNNVNKYGCKTIEIAIQYRDNDIVEKLVKSGAKINESIIKKSEFPAVGNNDMLGLCVQCNKYDSFKTLRRHGSLLHRIYIKGKNIHTVVLIGILFQRYEILKKILEIDEIKYTIDSSTKIFLLDYAINNGITDKNTLGLFTNEIIGNDILDPDDINIQQKSYEKHIIRFVPEYVNYDAFEKQHLLISLLNTLLILKTAINLSKLNLFTLLEYASDLIENVSTNILCENVTIEKLIQIVSFKIDYHNVMILHKCINLIYKIETMHFCEFHTTEMVRNIVNITTKIKDKSDLISKSINIVRSLFSKYGDDSDEDTKQKVIRTNQNNQNNTFVIRSLFKLYWPVKLDHYDYMLNNLINNNDVVITESDKLIIMSTNNIKSTVLHIKSKKEPSCWINTYAPNIGHEEKDDYNHNFSYLLDKKLEKWTCIEETTEDPMHENGVNKHLYFYGMIQYGDIIETGCYEYFINSYGTVFHRMFRPYKSLPKNVKEQLNI